MTHAAPFYLREHGKRMLRAMLFNDTKFLQSVNVMDYSLLVGVDDQSNELVLGIVGAYLEAINARVNVMQIIFEPLLGIND